MKTTWLLAAALAAGGAVALAQNAPIRIVDGPPVTGTVRPVSGPAVDPGAEQYQAMTKHLKLTAEQPPKIKAILEKMDEALKDNKDKTNEAQATLRAPGPKTPEVYQTYQKDMAELNQQRKQIQTDAQAEIDRILTVEQRGDWQGYQILQSITPRLGAAGDLTAKQQEQLDNLCKAAGKEVVTAKDPAEARTAAFGKLWRQVFATVLSDEQTAKVFGGSGYGYGSGLPVVRPPFIAKPLPEPLPAVIVDDGNVAPKVPVKQPPVRIREDVELK